MNEYPPCPKCGGQNFKVWKLPSPVIVHWVLNPGLAFNELVLGQRIPKVMLICLDCQGRFTDRGYVLCPHCKTMNHGRSWGRKYGFFNWLGYVCPCCGKRIPCVWNFTSLLILAITSPIWYLPYRYYFRDRVPAKPPLFDLTKLPPSPKPMPRKVWIFVGAVWGLTMWMIRSLGPALVALSKGHSPNWNHVFIQVPIDAFGIWGFYVFILGLIDK